MYLADGVARRGGKADAQPARLQRAADGVFGKLGRVVLVAQVREQNVARARADAFDGEFRRGVVRQVPVLAQDALLEVVRVAAVFEHHDIVIRLEQQHVRAEGDVVRLIGDKARVRQHGERACVALDAVADAFFRVVRRAERADVQVLDRKLFARGKGAQARLGVLDGRRGAERRIQRGGAFFGERHKSSDMVDVLVRDENAVEVVERKAQCCERLRDAAAGDARVDEKVGIVVTDERGVAGARTGEGVKFHGMIPLYQFTEIIPQPRAIVKKKKPPHGGCEREKKALSTGGESEPCHEAVFAGADDVARGERAVADVQVGLTGERGVGIVGHNIGVTRERLPAIACEVKALRALEVVVAQIRLFERFAQRDAQRFDRLVVHLPAEGGKIRNALFICSGGDDGRRRRMPARAQRQKEREQQREDEQNFYNAAFGALGGDDEHEATTPFR